MAVYTEVSFEDLERLLQEYDIGTPLTFKGIAEGVENSNFYLQTDRGGFFLTLYEKRVSPADLPFYLGLMEHLARRGITCPVPVPTRSGALSTNLNDRACAVVTFLNGLSVRRPSAAHCAGAGAALARLHLAGEGFALTRANALGPAGWKPLAEACDAHADKAEDGLAALIRDQLAALTAAWPSLPSGVIHADLFPDNVLFTRQDAPGIIDFYFACNDMFAYDLAITLNSWCFEPDGSYNLTKGMAMAQAYRAVRPLSEAEIAAMPLLMRGCSLRFLLTRLFDLVNHDPNALVMPKDPKEYSKKLRFHMKVKDAREYGFE